MKKIILFFFLLMPLVISQPDFYPIEGYAFSSTNNQMPLATNVVVINNNNSFNYFTQTFGPPGNTGYYSINNLLGFDYDNISVVGYNNSHYGVNYGLLSPFSLGITRINTTINNLRNSELNVTIIYPASGSYITPNYNFSLDVVVDNVGWQVGNDCYINLSFSDDSIINSSAKSVYFASLTRFNPQVISFNLTSYSFGATDVFVSGICLSDDFYIENLYNDTIFLNVDPGVVSFHPVEGYIFNSDLSMASTGVSVTVTSLITGDVLVTQTFGPPGNTGYYSVNNLEAFDNEPVLVRAESGLVFGESTATILPLSEGITRINVTMNESNGISVNNVTLDDSLLFPANELMLSPNSFTNFTCNATIQSGNSLDVVNATIFHYLSGNDGVLDNNSLYKDTSCTLINSFAGNYNYSCKFSVAYYANNGTWTCSVFAKSNTNTDFGFDNSTILPLYSFDLDSSLIDYGTVIAGNQSVERTVNITNTGNMNFSLYLWGFGGNENSSGYGNSFNCVDNNISVSYHRFSFINGISYSSKNFLSADSSFSGLTINKQFNNNLIRNTTYWQMSVPELDPIIGIGQCNGTVVFEAFS